MRDESGALSRQVAALKSENVTLTERLATLESNVVLQLGPYLQITDSGVINRLKGPHVIFSGVNLHVRNGMGQTGSVNGLGNLIVDYNETMVVVPRRDRSGSHNLVIGPEHSFSSYGGLIAGYWNAVSGRYATVSGGAYNTASANQASVSGGRSHEASEMWNWRAGGLFQAQ